LPGLLAVHFEGNDNGSFEGSDNGFNLGSAIAEPSGTFNDACCGLGPHVNMSRPVAGLTFCDMKARAPGANIVCLPFIQLIDATPTQVLRPSSTFMAEASESVKKCAECCAMFSECRCFSYDARLPNAERICNLLKNNGTGSFEVCCDPDHHADAAGTKPGWISGLPPQTQHEVDNALVLSDPHNLVVEPSNRHQTQFELSLGLMPIRGAVWIEPTLAASLTTELAVSFSPSRVAHDANATATATVTVANLDPDATLLMLVAINAVHSCNVACVVSEDLLATALSTVHIEVNVPDATESDSNLALAITVPLAALALLALLMFLCI
jgi:hypothetical protein